MHIDGINSISTIQQESALGTKAMAESQGFARQLQQATEQLAAVGRGADTTAKRAAKPQSEMTPEELKYDKKLREACQGFEAMFLNMMYREMRQTVPENELFGNSNADKILHDMLDTEMVNSLSKAGGVGLADVIYKQLTMENQAKLDMSERAAQHRLQREQGNKINTEA